MHSAVTSVTALQSVVRHNGFPTREIMPLSARVGESFSLVPRLLGLGPRTFVGHGPPYDTATGLPRHGHWPSRSRPQAAPSHVRGTCEIKTEGHFRNKGHFYNKITMGL